MHRFGTSDAIGAVRLAGFGTSDAEVARLPLRLATRSHTLRFGTSDAEVTIGDLVSVLQMQKSPLDQGHSARPRLAPGLTAGFGTSDAEVSLNRQFDCGIFQRASK